MNWLSASFTAETSQNLGDLSLGAAEPKGSLPFMDVLTTLVAARVSSSSVPSQPESTPRSQVDLLEAMNEGFQGSLGPREEEPTRIESMSDLPHLSHASLPTIRQSETAPSSAAAQENLLPLPKAQADVPERAAPEQIKNSPVQGLAIEAPGIQVEASNSLTQAVTKVDFPRAAAPEQITNLPVQSPDIKAPRIQVEASNSLTQAVTKVDFPRAASPEQITNFPVQSPAIEAPRIQMEASNSLTQAVTKVDIPRAAAPEQFTNLPVQSPAIEAPRIQVEASNSLTQAVTKVDIPRAAAPEQVPKLPVQGLAIEAPSIQVEASNSLTQAVTKVDIPRAAESEQITNLPVQSPAIEAPGIQEKTDTSIIQSLDSPNRRPVPTRRAPTIGRPSLNQSTYLDIPVFKSGEPTTQRHSLEPAEIKLTIAPERAEYKSEPRYVFDGRHMVSLEAETPRSKTRTIQMNKPANPGIDLPTLVQIGPKPPRQTPTRSSSGETLRTLTTGPSKFEGAGMSTIKPAREMKQTSALASQESYGPQDSDHSGKHKSPPTTQVKEVPLPVIGDRIRSTTTKPFGLPKPATSPTVSQLHIEKPSGSPTGGDDSTSPHQALSLKLVSEPTKQGAATIVITEPTRVSQVPEAIVDRLRTQLRTERQTIEIELDPARLGKLKVELHFDQKTRRVEGAIQVFNEAARDAIEAQMPGLKNRLVSDGVSWNSNINLASENQQNADRQSEGQGRSHSTNPDESDAPIVPNPSKTFKAKSNGIYA